jgi:hypothetical protein
MHLKSPRPKRDEYERRALVPQGVRLGGAVTCFQYTTRPSRSIIETEVLRRGPCTGCSAMR